jgi:hypothetical protein
MCVVRLDLRDDGPDIQGYLAQLTNQRSVPNVFISELAPYAIPMFVLFFDADAPIPRSEACWR